MGGLQNLPAQGRTTSDGPLMGPEKQLGQVPTGLVVIQPEGAGGLLAPGRQGVVHLDVGASGGLLNPVAAARSLEAQLGLTERVLGTQGRGAVSTPKSRQSVRSFVPQNRYARGRLATNWYRCRTGLAAPKALPQLALEPEFRLCLEWVA